jgi:large subunit ribosomal protein L9
MPAGANGKLYGAVTSQTVVEELAKHGFPTERKRVELPGNTFKSVGKYKVTVKLYESAAAEVNLTIEAQIVKTETKEQPVRKDRRRRQSFEVGLGKTAAAEDIAAETGAGETAAAGSAEVESVSTEIPAADTSKADDADVTVSPAEANTEQN